MKIFLGAAAVRPLDRRTARACLLVNLFMTPGLGTLMAGRILMGSLQLLLAIAGFCLLMLWFYQLFRSTLLGAEAPLAWLWHWGLIFFGSGWCGSLVSSLLFFRRTTPPKLDPPRL